MGCASSRASPTPAPPPPTHQPRGRRAPCWRTTLHLPPSTSPPPAHARAAPDGVLDTDTLHVDTVAGVTFVNQYVVAGRLGRGAHGAVRAAVDTRSGALVALKVAPRWGRADKAALLAGGRRGRAARAGGGGADTPGAAAREAALLRALAAASVPGVVRLLELVDDPRRDRLLLVLDFAERGAVGAAAAPRTVCAARVWNVASGVAAALAGMHAAGVAHGDVKPDNVLERGDGRIVLADLGAAKPAAELSCGGESGDDSTTTTTTTTLTRPSSLAHLAAAPGSSAGGTPAFAPPEACGTTPRDPRAATAAAADVWALGVTLHCLAYGVLPFSGAPLDMCEAIVGGEPDLPKDAGAQAQTVSPASPLAAFISSALAKDPSDRPSAAELAVAAAAGAAQASAGRPTKPAFFGGSGHRTRFPPGARVAREGDPARHALAVASGTLNIVCEREIGVPASSSDDDGDGAAGDKEFDGGASDDDAAAARAAARRAPADAGAPEHGRMVHPPSLALLGRSQTVSETVTGATERAAALVEAARVGGQSATVIATRGPGALVAEPALLDAGYQGSDQPAVWLTSVVAGPRGAAVVRVPPATTRAAAAADADAADALDAALAARRAELLVASALERLAALAARLRTGEELGAACDAAVKAEES